MSTHFNSLAYGPGEPSLSELRALLAPAARLVERTAGTVLDLAMARRDGRHVSQDAAEAVVAAQLAAVAAYSVLRDHLRSRYPSVVNYPLPQQRSAEKNIADALGTSGGDLVSDYQPTAADMIRRGLNVLDTKAAPSKDPAAFGWSKGGHSQPCGLTADEADARDRAGLPNRYNIITGPHSGVYVIETDTFDRGPLGEITIAKLAAELGPLPDGPYMVTRSGSVHRHFDYAALELPEGTKVKTSSFNGGSNDIGPGVDIRGDGGQVFCLDGDARVWHNWHLPFPALPATWVEHLTKHGLLKTVRINNTTPRVFDGEGYGEPDAVAALEWWCEYVADAEANLVPRNKACNMAVFVGAGIVASGNLDETFAREELTDAIDIVKPEWLPSFETAWAAGYAEPMGPDKYRTYHIGLRTKQYAASAGAALGAEFWAARPALAHIRRAAHSSLASPAAVLNVVLARVGAFTGHYVRLPGLGGGEVGSAPLSIFAANISPSGIGKSIADDVARGLLPNRDDNVKADLPPGTGEGIAEVLFASVPDPSGAGGGKSAKVKAQVWHNALISLDEGQILANLSDRSGSTIAPTIRTLFTGGGIGQTNANKDTNRPIPAKSYTISLTLNLQPKMGGDLLRDAAGGTPQRFSWADARDSSLPDLDALPDWPGPLEWKPPCPPVSRYTAGTTDDVLKPRTEWDTVLMDVDPTIRRELRERQHAKQTGRLEVPELDSHLELVRLKVAGCLALLDGRLDVTKDDWQLAGMWTQASVAVRTALVAETARVSEEREADTTRKLVARTVEMDRARATVPVLDLARKLADKVRAAGPGGVTYKVLKDKASKPQRAIFPEAVDVAAAEGWITEQSESGQGASRRLLLPGVGA
jgi:hypothetical protein